MTLCGFTPDQRAGDLLGLLPVFQRTADGKAHRQHFSLRPVEWCDHLQLVPSVHRLADLEEAGGGV